MTRKKYLLLMAGGCGSRMGAPVPKQFLELGGKAVLHRTLEKFIDAEPDIRVVTVLPDEYIGYWKDYCAARGVTARQTLVRGGISRFHSVRNALEAVPDGALAAVHDGARPLLSAALIKKMFGLAEEVPALVPVIPSTDTLRALKRSEEASGEVRYEPVAGLRPDRSLLFRVQTPQIFHPCIYRRGAVEHKAHGSRRSYACREDSSTLIPFLSLCLQRNLYSDSL